MFVWFSISRSIQGPMESSDHETGNIQIEVQKKISLISSLPNIFIIRYCMWFMFYMSIKGVFYTIPHFF